MIERRREVDGQFVYHKRPLLAISVGFNAEVRQGSIRDAIAATQEVLRD